MGDYGAEQVKHRQLMWQKPRQSHWRFYLTLYNSLLNVPVWWNWYTRRIQNPLLRGVPVRVRALVPAHIVGPIRRLFLGAFLCLKYQFIEPFIELFRPNFYLSADGWGVGRLEFLYSNWSTRWHTPEADFEPKCLEQIISNLNPNQKNSPTQVSSSKARCLSEALWGVITRTCVNLWLTYCLLNH